MGPLLVILFVVLVLAKILKFILKGLVPDLFCIESSSCFSAKIYIAVWVFVEICHNHLFLVCMCTSELP